MGQYPKLVFLNQEWHLEWRHRRNVMKEVHTTVSVGLRDQHSEEEPEKKFQGLNVSIPSSRTVIWIKQDVWDKLSSDKKEDALALMSGAWGSFMYEWIADSIDTVDILAGVKPVEGDENGNTT